MPVPLVLLTRPRTASETTAARLQRAGVDPSQVLVAPLMETEATAVDWSPEAWAGLIFTSAEGVRHAAAGRDLRWRRAWCVGDRTAEAATAAGMDAESAGGTADDLVAMLSRQRVPGPLLHLCGADTRGDLADRLCRSGTDTAALVLYRQVPVPLDPEAQARLTSATDIVAPAFSPLSAERLAAALAGLSARVHLIAMSGATAEGWSGPSPHTTTVIPTPDGAAMERAIVAALRVEAGEPES